VPDTMKFGPPAWPNRKTGFTGIKLTENDIFFYFHPDHLGGIFVY
jgi:hypothetical protein